MARVTGCRDMVVDGHAMFAATGGRSHAPGLPYALLLHGAGMDHTVWALQSRWLAFHGWNVVALDLPGHGRSAGAPLVNIEAMAAWVVGVIESVGAQAATLIGHSMGALVALEAAARDLARVERLVLIGAAATMPVHPELLAAAAADDHGAIDRVNLWGYGPAAGLGGSAAPGLWMVGAGERILERSAPGVLHADLAACHAYQGGFAAAARLAAPARTSAPAQGVVPVLVIGGERDQMTPLKGARALAAAIPGAELVVVPGAGHMLMAERPHAIEAALRKHLAVQRAFAGTGPAAVTSTASTANRKILQRGA